MVLLILQPFAYPARCFQCMVLFRHAGHYYCFFYFFIESYIRHSVTMDMAKLPFINIELQASVFMDAGVYARQVFNLSLYIIYKMYHLPVKEKSMDQHKAIRHPWQPWYILQEAETA